LATDDFRGSADERNERKSFVAVKRAANTETLRGVFERAVTIAI
jgi:hypothetical protein